MMYNKQLSPPTGGDPLQHHQQHHQHYVEEHTSDSAAEEAIAWSSLCDQFTRNLLKLELQTTETQYRSELIEEESALRVFIYNSLLFGITSHSARLSGQFSDLMENVRTLQNSHDKLLNEKQTHAHAIAEYHAQQILEQRSQAEAQAVNYQTRIENLREDERDLRVRVENLRREAEESQTNLEKRRNDSLEERRVLENDLQRLQNEVGSQKYLLDRLNAQVDSAKQKLRETERVNIERSVSGGFHHSSTSRNQSPADTTQHHQQRAGNYDNYSTTPRPAAASSTPLSALPPPHSSAASPDRHGDSISTGLSNIQTVRDSGVDEQFLRTGRVTPVRIPPQFYASSQQQQQQQNNNNSNTHTRTPIFNSNASGSKQDQNNTSSSLSSTKTPLAGLSATAQRSVSDVYQSHQHQIYSPAAMNASRNPMINGGLFDQQQQQQQQKQQTSTTTRGIGSSIISQQQQQQPSQWQLRLMKLQGELKSLKNDLGVASPPQVKN